MPDEREFLQSTHHKLFDLSEMQPSVDHNAMRSSSSSLALHNASELTNKRLKFKLDWLRFYAI